jgi:hypothetical protein
VIGSTGSAATLTRDVLEAGSYTVHVTAVSGTGGPYTLTASLSEPVYAANDACDAPATVPLYSGTLAGDSRGATDSVGPTCAPGTARDLSYQVTLAPRGRVWVEVTPASTSFDPVIVTQANCGGAETACWNSAGPGGVETADFLVDGSASFWVDGADGTEGAFTVRGTSTWSAPDNDLCTARTALALATATPPVPISASGSVIAAFSDGGCAGGAVDTFYEVQANWTGGGAKPIRVRLTPYEFVGKLTVYADCLATTCGTSVTGAGVGAEVTLPLSIAQGARVIVAVSSADGGISSYSISAGQ